MPGLITTQCISGPELVCGKIQQTLEMLVKRQKTGLFEQPCKVLGLITRRVLCGLRQIKNQHMITAPPRKGVSFTARHQTGMQPIDRAALPHHLEIRTAVQPNNQLMLRVGVSRGLYRQVEYFGLDHASLDYAKGALRMEAQY